MLEDLNASKTFNLCRDYQSRAEKFGETFEERFQIYNGETFSGIRLERKFSFPKAYMVAGGEAYFLRTDTVKKGKNKNGGISF